MFFAQYGCGLKQWYQHVTLVNFSAKDKSQRRSPSSFIFSHTHIYPGKGETPLSDQVDSSGVSGVSSHAFEAFLWTRPGGTAGPSGTGARGGDSEVERPARGAK